MSQVLMLLCENLHCLFGFCGSLCLCCNQYSKSGVGSELPEHSSGTCCFMTLSMWHISKDVVQSGNPERVFHPAHISALHASVWKGGGGVFALCVSVKGEAEYHALAALLAFVFPPSRLQLQNVDKVLQNVGSISAEQAEGNLIEKVHRGRARLPGAKSIARLSISAFGHGSYTLHDFRPWLVSQTSQP